MNIPITHWLRFYRKPLIYLALISTNFFLFGQDMSRILTEGLELETVLFAGLALTGAGVFCALLYEWRKQFLRWKFQSFQRGGSHSSHLEEYDDSEYRKRFESK